MIKHTLIPALFLFLPFSMLAQDRTTDNRETFQIGVKFGGTYSNVYDAKGEDFDADSKAGLTGGAFFMIPIGKYLGIQPEVMLTQKGFKGSGSLLGSSYSFKRTTTFLEIPVFVAFKPSEFVTFLVGPQFSYLLSKKDKFDSSIASFTQEQEFEQDNVRKNILGFVAGLDINLAHFVIGGRFGWDLQTNLGDGTSSTPRYKNVCAQLTLGYKFY
jgi:hypothetical protein